MTKLMHRTLGWCVLLTAAIPASALTIANVGLDTTTTNNWRETFTIKPLDLDGDYAYGTAGYFTFAPGNHGDFAGGTLFSPWDQSGGVLSNGGLTLTDPLPAFHGRYSGGYHLIDDPTLAPGPSVANENAGFAFWPTTIPGFYTLLTVTVGSNLPSWFRIGLMDVGNNGDDSSFVLYTATATNSIALGPDNDPVYPVRYTFFDILGATQGETFSIAVSSTTGTSIGNALGLSAISVDFVPEPSAFVQLGMGGLLLLVRRCRC